jgi:hypothetical protein
LLLLALAAASDPSQRPIPVSAHNCYRVDSSKNDRLVAALALGIDNIEIDLGWDEARGRLIVGHDESPRPGVAYPELESYLVPALEDHWRRATPDGAPTVLTIDWKTSRPEAVRRFKTFLDAHTGWFTSAPKAAESPLSTRRLTVCFTGSDAAKHQYDAMVPPGEMYRAFRDTVYGGGGYQKDVTQYAPARASAYHRFLTFHWGNVERGGPPLAGAWTREEEARLKSLVDHLHRQGFRVRFYCLDGHTGPVVSPYRFRDAAAARARWRAAAKAGADWVATDEYEEIVEELGRRDSPQRTQRTQRRHGANAK